jgi:PAS domain S-box-containing protein
MKNFQYLDPGLFEAFIKSAQYIVHVKTQQDIWDHLGKFILKHFPADWTAVVQRDSLNNIMIHHCTLSDSNAARFFLTDEVRNRIYDVLDSGFLASQVIPTPAPSMTAFLPIVEERKPDKAILIGHKTDDPLPNELLNIYLAIAGLAGATIERLHKERELNRHRDHLEELVKERTAELEKAKRRHELILQSVGEGICGMDLDGNIIFANPSAATIIGWEPNELIGRNAHETFHHHRPDGCLYPMEECSVYSTLRNGDTHFTTDEEFLCKDGTCFPVEFMSTPIMEEGVSVGAVMVFRDITERKNSEDLIRKSLEEKEALLKEIHHRVKNNLQIVYSMLNLQTSQIKDKDAIELFKESKNRIFSMALIHEKLYQSKSLAKVDLGEYIRNLTNNLFSSYGVSERTISPKIHVENITLNIDTVIPCALIINELVSNSLKYGFPDLSRRRSGESEIRIELRRAVNNRFTLTISDNGVGLPEGFEIQKSESLGLKLVSVLVNQLQGSIRVDTNRGVEFAITFKADK